MKVPVVSCCAFFFSFPYPLCVKVVYALGHHVCPSNMIGSNSLQFIGWNGTNLEGLLDYIFPSFLRSRMSPGDHWPAAQIELAG